MSTDDQAAADLHPDTLIFIRAGELARIRKWAVERGLSGELQDLCVRVRSTTLQASAADFERDTCQLGI